MLLDDFDFPFDPGHIAERPVTPRDTARLLVVMPETEQTNSQLTDRSIKDLPELLVPGDHLIFNNTRVRASSFIGRRDTVKVRLLLSAQHDTENQDCYSNWQAFVRPAKRLKPGQIIEIAPDLAFKIKARLPNSGEFILQIISADPKTSLEQHGHMPLPPYIRHGQGDSQDHEDYQTLFATHTGAVAAPTAALHFTPALMTALANRGISWSFITLHVGSGTFQPVTNTDPTQHRMRPEWAELSATTAAQLNQKKQKGSRLVAIGSTVLRTLEAATTPDGVIRPFTGPVDLFILPGYQFRCVDLLMSNFHLPKSTLIMLVAAFSGTDTIKTAYRHALAQGYRFFSYGDATLLYPAPYPAALPLSKTL